MTQTASATEFNINAIDKDQRGSVDLSLFKDHIAVIPGDYFVTVSINDIPLANGWQLRWREMNNEVQVCIPPELADTFALQDSIRSALPEKEGCIDFSSRPDIKFAFDRPAGMAAVPCRRLDAAIHLGQRRAWRIAGLQPVRQSLPAQ
jgi:outer membrane usher protein FimD/PapC